MLINKSFVIFPQSLRIQMDRPQSKLLPNPFHFKRDPGEWTSTNFFHAETRCIEFVLATFIESQKRAAGLILFLGQFTRIEVAPFFHALPCPERAA